MVLYLDLPCTSFTSGISASKHNIFTLCYIAAELNALFPMWGPGFKQFSSVPLILISSFLVVVNIVMEKRHIA